MSIPVVISVFARQAATLSSSTHPYLDYAPLQSFKPILKISLFILCIYSVGNLFSGIYLILRRRRLFSYWMAVANLAPAPIGSIIAIMTIVALRRTDADKLYSA